MTALTRTAAGRIVAEATIVPRRTRVVRAARWPSVVRASSIGSHGSVPGSAWIRWSATKTLSIPASSAIDPTALSSLPIAPGQEKLEIMTLVRTAPPFLDGQR